MDDPTHSLACLLHESDDDPLKADRLNFCGDRSLELFRNTGDYNEIGRAIAAYEQAASCLSYDDPRLGRFLRNIGVGYLERYTGFGVLDDLQMAIDTMKKGVGVTADEHPDFPAYLNNLGISLLRRFERTGALDDVSEAIEIQQRAVQLTVDGHVGLPARLSNLGISILACFQRTGNLEDLSEAIKNQQLAVQITPDGHADLPAWLNNLGSSLLRRFQRSGDLEDLSEAIRNQQRAVHLTPDGHADLPALLNSLGLLFTCRFERSGDLQDLSEAIQNQQRAVHLTPDGHTHFPARLSALGASFLRRFERSGCLEDLSEAIKIQQRAVQLTPDGQVDLPSWLNNLGLSLSRRFERNGNLADISEAIKSQQRSVYLAPDGHSNLPIWLSNLGNSFLGRFQHSGDLDDISEAIRNQQRAVQLTPDGHADLPAFHNNLGTSFLRRFECSGDLEDLSESIRIQRRAVDFTPDGHADLPSLFNNLGNSCLRRFQCNGDLEDLSEAIRIQERAVHLTPDGCADLASWLTNLGTLYLCRFERSGNPVDISEAIKNSRHAVRLTPDGHAGLPLCLNSLGLSFLYRFECSGDLEDLSEAIQIQQRGVHLTPDGHADLPMWLSNLGISFSRRFERGRDLEDLSEAIRLQKRAVQLSPDGHPGLPACLNNLGISFSIQYECTGDPEFLAKAISSYRLSATSATGRPSRRLETAKKWAKLARTPSQLMDAHACIIQLISLVSGLENTVQRRHQTLVNSSQLSIAACAAALSLGRPDKALEWLAEGRCIVWNQINQLRTPVDELRAHDEDLADSFSAVARELENAGSRSESLAGSSDLSIKDYKISLEEQAVRHIKLVKEWDRLLVTIRNISGFEDFLRPKMCADIMRRLPDEGAIVIINIDNDRCDALAVMAGADEPMHILLPQFSYKEAERLAKGLHGHLLRRRVISRIGIPLHDPDNPPLPDVDLPEVLGVLWSQVVWPILESLAISVPDTGESSAKMPRIWWCPTGPLAFLPIHAAGIYVRGVGMPNQCLSEFAVSSYIPTVDALLNTTESNSVKKGGDVPTGMLVVSQPNTPGMTPIPHAAAEAKGISKRFEERQISSITLSDASGTVEGVLKAMKSFSSIHLACHARQNTTSPLKSSIYLHDGPLELSEVMKKKLPDSDFAFLSACQTSTGDKNLPEEVVHLAAGMLAAGYQSVVGTMWSIVDEHGADIAESFYESLLDNTMTEAEGPKIDCLGVARALQRATQRFREKFSHSPEDSLLVWVPYIHIGV